MFFSLSLVNHFKIVLSFTFTEINIYLRNYRLFINFAVDF